MMSDQSDPNSNAVGEPIPNTEQNELDMTVQILSACLKEYPGIELHITDYQKIYEDNERRASAPYIVDKQGQDYQYFAIPTGKKDEVASLGIPVFAKGFFEKIQDPVNRETYYVIYPSRGCQNIEVLKFPFNMLKPFLDNDQLRKNIVEGVKSDNTEDLKQRFGAIEKISKRFNS